MKKIIKTALAIAYCIPFAFLSVYGDATSGTLIYYALMAGSFTVLCWYSLKTDNIPIIYIGNVLSGVSSYVAAKVSGMGPMAYYFKPFTSYSLIVGISIFSIICQTIPVMIHTGRKKRKRPEHD